ncbi:MAG: glycosyl hydrolase family 18 protein [Flavobacteriales bacterium]
MIKKLLLLFLVFLFTQANAQSFRKTGYIPNHRWSTINSINFSNLTHIFVAFVNPIDTSGTITFSQNLSTLVNKAHLAGCKVIPSYAGGGDFSWGPDTVIYKTLIDTNHRTEFIHKMMEFTRLNKLDGIDLDLEGQALQLKDYNAFAQEVADSVHSAGLEMTAALGIGWNNTYANAISDATLEKMDFITTMSYGGVGSWNYNNPTDQFAYSDFTSDIDYWLSRGMTKNQVVGGLAFYGAEFPMSSQSSYWQYSPTLCSIYTKSAYSSLDPVHNDWITDPVSKHPINYNGLPTFKKKIEYAVENAGGYMVWELGGDCFGSKIRVIDSLNTYVSEALSVHDFSSKVSLTTYPNPCYNDLWVDGLNYNDTWKIYNYLGDEILNGNGRHINTASLIAGFYIIKSSMGITRFIKN